MIVGIFRSDLTPRGPEWYLGVVLPRIFVAIDKFPGVLPGCAAFATRGCPVVIDVGTTFRHTSGKVPEKHPSPENFLSFLPNEGLFIAGRWKLF